MRSPTVPPAPVEPEIDDVKAAVRARAGHGPVAPAELMRTLGRGRLRPLLHRAVREMVASGELAYTLEHGRTLLEPSFDRPVRVSARITLAPPGRGDTPPAGGVLVRLAPGAAFGAGRHPTTRLALRGVDRALERGRAGGRVLDVGTGTGVLAIAAVALGMSGGLGLDLDPCALSEAHENVRLNGMEGRIRISAERAERVTDAFELVSANLRPPTLARLAGTLRKRVQAGGVLVVSGMRIEERADIAAALQCGGELRSVWVEEEAGWAAVLLEREE
jgi:ribosomal protein L11 methyltransferase